MVIQSEEKLEFTLPYPSKLLLLLMEGYGLWLILQIHYIKKVRLDIDP
jgi:hypothetical protein